MGALPEKGRQASLEGSIRKRYSLDARRKGQPRPLPLVEVSDLQKRLPVHFVRFHTFPQSPRFGRRPFPSENKQPVGHTVKDGSTEVTHLRATELETLASQADA